MNLSRREIFNKSFYATTDDQFDTYLNQYILYVIVGSISGSVNIVTVILIMRRKELRDNYFAQSVLAFGDFCDSFAHLVAGSMRLSYLYTDKFNIPMSSFNCMLKPFNPAFVLTALLTGVTTLIISTERFICVFKPTFYFHNPMKRYNTTACAIGIVICLVAVMFGYVVAYMRDTVITNSCITSVTVGESYSLFYYGTNVATFGLAILLYLCITVTIICPVITSNFSVNHSQTTSARIVRQAKVTRMMGAVFANIFCLQFLPNFVIVAAIGASGVTQPWYTNNVGYLTLLMDASGPLNAITYAYFTEEIRYGFRDIFACRSFGDNHVYPLL